MPGGGGGGGHKVPAAFYFRTTNAYDLKLVTFIEQLNTDTLTEKIDLMTSPVPVMRSSGTVGLCFSSIL